MKELCRTYCPEDFRRYIQDAHRSGEGNGEVGEEEEEEDEEEEEEEEEEGGEEDS
jgi:hypothetical protein